MSGKQNNRIVKTLIQLLHSKELSLPIETYWEAE
jgi:hypothetical protein